ncbi:MerR family transcriptional regulator [Celeribacter sp. PS-C1]|uniref:MerR family transcriptional regulator n=1 Tax=Celeribacter sp. PS-C1 TaxID=2820813 RepID=UPI002102527A|nr:MerR family transcriptional regulator [Celeribacter sp. PS-C1]
MDKSPDAFRTISEVADWLDTPAHVLRFWESRFTQVKPVKRAGGRRYYRPADMALLGGIKKLLHDDGMTIRGVQKLLREHGVKYVASLSPIIEGVEPITAPAPTIAPIPSAPVPPAPMAEMVPQDDDTQNFGADETTPPPETVVPFARPEPKPEPAPPASEAAEGADFTAESFAPHGFEPPAHVQEDSLDLPDAAPAELPEEVFPVAEQPESDAVVPPAAKTAEAPPTDALPGQAAFDFDMAPAAAEPAVEESDEVLPPIAAEDDSDVADFTSDETQSSDVPVPDVALEAPFVDVPEEPMLEAAPDTLEPLDSLAAPEALPETPSDLSEAQPSPLGLGLDLSDDLEDDAPGITVTVGILGQLNRRGLTTVPAHELQSLIARIETLRDRLAG